MSRILVFDLENKIAGEVHADVKRGWSINNGVDATFALADGEASKPFMQLGRMVFIDGNDRLPNWSGMIDTPWNAVSPVTVTAYDIPYLMAIRSAYSPSIEAGNIRTLVMKLITLANAPDDLYIREGEITDIGAEMSLPVTTTPLWGQLQTLLKNSRMELKIRSELTTDRRLLHFVDVQQVLGEVLPTVLQDGEGGNMQIVSASVDGDIWNAVEGVNDASSQTSKLYSAISINQESVNLWRLRNRVEQFATVSATALQTFADNFLAANGSPFINLQVAVRDADNLFSSIRLGNILTVRATKLILPGGQMGWSGQARIEAMIYDESANQITLALRGSL